MSGLTNVTDGLKPAAWLEDTKKAEIIDGPIMYACSESIIRVPDTVLFVRPVVSYLGKYIYPTLARPLVTQRGSL